MSSRISARIYSIWVFDRGAIVLRRVRIRIGGFSIGSPVMIPSSVGSLDIAISASTAPASSSWPDSAR